MATPATLVSVSALEALTQFSTAFDGALVAAPPELLWAQQYGLHNSSSAIRTTYPLPISAAGYKERKGDDELRGLYTKSISLAYKEWTDGIEELASIVEAPDFIGWGNQPKEIALESFRHNNELVAAVLEANAVLEFDGKALFANDHPVNIFDPSLGEFDNLHSYTGITQTFVEETKTRFRRKKAQNGKPMRLRFNGLLLPPDREEEARAFFERDILVETVQNVAAAENVAAATGKNRHQGTVTLIVCDELSDANIIYPIDVTSGAYPWIIQDTGAPEEIRYDKTSEKYKNKGKIALKYVRRAAAVGALPHAIEQVTLTG